MNTSLALPASALPDRKAPAWCCVPSRSPGPQPAGAPRAPAAAPEASKGPAVPGARAGSAVPARKAGPGSAADPCIIIGDEWDDIDDFDLSGIEKKFSRPPVLSPKGLRAPRKDPPRPSPRPAEPGSPGSAGEDAGPGSRGGEAAPESEQRSCSQQSLICLEDLAPCSGSPAAGDGLREEAPADPLLDADKAGACPGKGLFEGTTELEGNLCLYPEGLAWLVRNQRELCARD